MMQVNIYYGGRGLIEDSTIYVMNKITKVLDELNIRVKKYNLYEDKRGISVLPTTLKDADAVILAASVEWLGIGGLLQQFLDACWLYGDKETISSLYMMPVAISTTYGEKEAYAMLVKAWEILGGKPCEGICADVNNSADFETNTSYGLLIEIKSENFYRNFTKKTAVFPSSNNAVLENVQQPKAMSLTPQESEQLSMYVSDDTYVKQQKEDIEELTQMFKGLMGDSEGSSGEPYIDEFKSHFHPIPSTALSFAINITDKDSTLIIETDDNNLNCYYGTKSDVNATIKAPHTVIENIISGESTLQGAFMTGEISASGNFKILRTFDSLFQFRK